MILSQVKRVNSVLPQKKLHHSSIPFFCLNIHSNKRQISKSVIKYYHNYEDTEYGMYHYIHIHYVYVHAHTNIKMSQERTTEEKRNIYTSPIILFIFIIITAIQAGLNPKGKTTIIKFNHL